MNTLQNKLNEVRLEAIVTIKDFFKENNLTYVNCTDFCCGTPMVTPTQSLDDIEFKDDTFCFGASGEYDNDYYGVSDVSTDFLVDLVKFVIFYKEHIIEQAEELREEN